MTESSAGSGRRRRSTRNRPRKAKEQIKTIPSSPMSECRNWVDLPNDVTALILSRLSMFDILKRAQKVCLTWRRICKDPMTWRTITMKFDINLRQQTEGNFTSAKRRKNLRKFHNFNVDKMCLLAINLSCGNLVDISIQNCGSDNLLEHMTDSSRGIRRLSIVFSTYITMEGLSKVASKIPLLEDLEISYTGESNTPFGRPYTEHKYLEVIGRSCPLLTSLRLNKHQGAFCDPEDNGDAVAIARTMHGLHNLQLHGNRLSQQGLHAILEGCPRLESLDLRRCTHLHLDTRAKWVTHEGCLKAFPGKGCSDLKSRCFEQIKQLRLPDDSTDDYERLDIHRFVDRQYKEDLKHMFI